MNPRTAILNVNFRELGVKYFSGESIFDAAGLPVAAAFGFMPGLLFGLRKGYDY